MPEGSNALPVDLTQEFVKKVGAPVTLQTFHKPKPLKPEDIPNGRPLFQRELGRKSPAPNRYNIQGHFVNKANPLQECSFGQAYSKYRKKMDIVKEVKIYDYESRPTTSGFLYPSMNQTKKKTPKFSIGTQKQNLLWDLEIKNGSSTPSPFDYRTGDEKQTKVTKHPGHRALGFGLKANQKEIEVTPGPTEYAQDTTTEENLQRAISRRISHNYKFKNGGINPPPKYSEKESLMLKSLGYSTKESISSRRNSNIRPSIKMLATEIRTGSRSVSRQRCGQS